MEFEGIRLTKGNYKAVLEGYDKEILDIVYMCIADQTDIGDYIKTSQDDPYRLWQIRYCIHEGVPESLYKKIRHGTTLRKVRQYLQDGYAIEDLERNMTETTGEKITNAIVDLTISGHNLQGIRFSYISEDCASALKQVIESGADIREYSQSKAITNARELMLIGTLIKQGKNIHYFMKGKWEPEVIQVICNELLYSDRYDEIMPYIDGSSTNTYYIQIGIQLCKRGHKAQDIFRQGVKLSDLLKMMESRSGAKKKTGRKGGRL